MNRRRFLVLTSLSVASVTLPLASCRSRNELLQTPAYLLDLTDKSTVTGIGRKYLMDYPSESAEDTLRKLVMEDINEDQSSSSLATSIIKKIQIDFLNERVVVVDGWVLSHTEARQAALYTFKS